MIELPEAVNLAKQFNETIKGKKIASVIAGLSPHKFAFYHGDPKGYDALLRGKAIGTATACGGMLETGIGRAFNIANASLPKFKYPSDMSPVNLFYQEDLVKKSFVFEKKGFVRVPDKPGLGFEIDEKKINQYSAEKITLS